MCIRDSLIWSAKCIFPANKPGLLLILDVMISNILCILLDENFFIRKNQLFSESFNLCIGNLQFAFQTEYFWL